MFDPFHSQQLDRILEELQKIENEDHKFDKEILDKFSKLIDLLSAHIPKAIASFNITDKGVIPMSVAQGPLAGIGAGQSAVVTANGFDSSGNPSTPASLALVTLVWTSSDSVNFPVSSSGNVGDLNATVSVPASAVPNADGSLPTATISVAQVAPLADGSNATGSATESLVVVAPPPPPPPVAIAQFIITQASAA